MFQKFRLTFMHVIAQTIFIWLWQKPKFRCWSFFRDLDRERAKMEQQEKKVIADIKKMAKAGQMVWQYFFKIAPESFINVSESVRE